MRVWDKLVRSLHWLLVASVLTAWTSGHVEARWFDFVHHTAGYVAGGIVVLRVIWGFAGSHYARFVQFVHGPRATWAYAKQLPFGTEPRYIGHNPLGGWMVLALLLMVGSASLSGFLYTTDWLWGYEWLSTLHAALAWLISGLVGLHIGGVLLTSWRHKENLVQAMVTGRKRAARDADVAS
jgi:cytochrome b